VISRPLDSTPGVAAESTIRSLAWCSGASIQHQPGELVDAKVQMCSCLGTVSFSGVAQVDKASPVGVLFSARVVHDIAVHDN
jgi:hypothetical protein